MTETRASGGLATRLMLAFAAGFLATVIFHQLALVLLWSLGIAPFPPFQMAGTAPFGVPALISLAFWGGVWGIVFAWAEAPLPRRCGLLGHGVSVWRYPAIDGRPAGGIAPQGTPPGRRLAAGFAVDGVPDQWRLGYRYRLDTQGHDRQGRQRLSNRGAARVCVAEDGAAYDSERNSAAFQPFSAQCRSLTFEDALGRAVESSIYGRRSGKRV